MTEEKKGDTWERLKRKYKLSLHNVDTYEEVFNMRLSPMWVLVVSSTVAVILVLLTILLIVFTGLREFIPGYPDENMRTMITGNALRADSLGQEIARRDHYLRAIQKVLRGEDYDIVASRNDSLHRNYDTIQFNLSQQESEFRTTIEEKERFNLVLGGYSDNHTNNQTKGYYHFFAPVEGLVSREFDDKAGHYGLDLVAKADSRVSAVMAGVVVFTDWTIRTGNVIQVQHANNLLSIYKHNSVLLKKQGDYVREGEAIAVVGNTGELSSGPHLHFELWRAGTPMNPMNFIVFK
ncbi:peptidase M23 [Bacteroidia bacterium]|nr:peptidase M23 [Bacteroidia bacterium]